jgi:hypothetical protein
MKRIVAPDECCTKQSVSSAAILGSNPLRLYKYVTDLQLAWISYTVKLAQVPYKYIYIQAPKNKQHETGNPGFLPNALGFRSTERTNLTVAAV